LTDWSDPPRFMIVIDYFCAAIDNIQLNNMRVSDYRPKFTRNIVDLFKRSSVTRFGIIVVYSDEVLHAAI
jgi:hypothetical protein